MLKEGRQPAMQASYADQLTSGAYVWIWVVRLARGRWWPGIVEQITKTGNITNFKVRFECSSTKGRRPYTFVGISTTRARYLEPRDPELKETDRPRFVPVSLLQQPAESCETALQR